MGLLLVLIIVIIAFYSCKSSRTIADMMSDEEIRAKILGIWTDSWPPEGTIEITADSIHYLAERRIRNESYRYQIKNGTLLVDDPKHNYIPTISFKNDTMIMNDQGNILKFWKPK